MKVLVTGVKGQLGYDTVIELEKRNHVVIGVDIEEMDITDSKSVERVITNANVDAVIHCAAYTAVDAAEDHREICNKINVEGTQNIALICKKLDIKLIYISTDYVFNGEGVRPWEPDDKREPLNAYGESKYKGELIIERNLEKYFIVRTAWVFGANGNNFIKTMLKLAESKTEISVVSDQIGSPTYTVDLAVLLVRLVETEKYGRYHATNEGFCSWFEFAKEIFRQAGVEIIVNSVDSSMFPAKAKRPHNSRMSKDKLDMNGFSRLPKWQDALQRYLQVIR
ncbi:dTDP-4-dehydrorhamnose reductase [Lachnospiraceae bacterium LCP25S3_G4]